MTATTLSRPTHNFIPLIELASTATGKATYYNTADEQTAALISTHIEALNAERSLYGVIALLPINEANKLLILRGLLATGNQRDETADEYEWGLITAIIKDVSISRMLRFYTTEICPEDSSKERLNNARTRRLGRHLWMTASDYQLVKYRSKFKRIARHIRLRDSQIMHTQAEIRQWMFGELDTPVEDIRSSMLKNRIKAGKGDHEALIQLPMDVAQGIATGEGIDLSTLKKKQADAGKLSKGEKLRARSASKGDARASISVDWMGLNLTELIRYAKSHTEDWAEIKPVIDRKAADLARGITLPADCAFVFDTSASMSGSREQSGLPISVAEQLARIVIEAGAWVNFTNSSNVDLDAGPIRPTGYTGIRVALARSIQTVGQNGTVVIVSDGYENAASGSVDAILNTPAVKASGIRFYHINPVAAAEGKSATRSLSERIKPLAVGNTSQLTMAAILSGGPEKVNELLVKVYSAAISGDFVKAKRIGSGKSRPGLNFSFN